MKQFVTILAGNAFVVSDGRGDIEPSPLVPTGMFSFDLRFLSEWKLTVNGERLHALSVDDLQYYESRYFLVPGEPTHYLDAKVSVIRHRQLIGGLREELTVLNHRGETVEFTVRLDMAADFVDVFELKQTLDTKRTTSVVVESDGLRLRYVRGDYVREAVVTSSAPADIDERGMTFRLRLEPHGQWTTSLYVSAYLPGGHRGQDIRELLETRRPAVNPETQRDLESWLAGAPQLGCDDAALATAYRRGLIDLAALQFGSLATGANLIAAGTPWFMTFYGRDSMLTCIQAMAFTPQLAVGTLNTFAATQATVFDDFREKEPGKILHEFRYGESSAFEEEPHSPYYGAADSTPLFVILLDEYERWTGDIELVRRLEHEARAALHWIDTYGDLLGNGYVSYERRNTASGLENQGWKDSPDSISYRDGRLPSFPLATCELQGYAYDAKIRGARLARRIWHDPIYADRLEAEAADLKARFNRDFWVSDGEYYALALDADGGQVDALSSNMGHLLWSGIVDPSRAGRVAEHLLGPRLFSGWGIRTLAEGEERYNPTGYHTGAIWPFDNSFIALGLRRYGFDAEAGRITQAIIDASQYFDGRLPQLFAGYDRGLTKYPVQYPTTWSPHAWSAGTPLMLIRVLLGLEPHDDHLVVDPALPEGMGRIELLDVPGRWGRLDAFGRDRVESQQRRSGRGGRRGGGNVVAP
ncbi:amylo-alpha-1,6-glucosidase [Micromonospora sp. NBC_01699]|uniref:amylo-alpha-1,6-glucosidase n=1 Tax=Micromonospora sp. NBC_01699 TaxID=2975984 RepID=UPI002E2C32D2|nr:glycogen debranching N-terminal domain-containing protein [Micromonospora sp. NBC_01699]